MGMGMLGLHRDRRLVDGASPVCEGRFDGVISAHPQARAIPTPAGKDSISQDGGVFSGVSRCTGSEDDAPWSLVMVMMERSPRGESCAARIAAVLLSELSPRVQGRPPRKRLSATQSGLVPHGGDGVPYRRVCVPIRVIPRYGRRNSIAVVAPVPGRCQDHPQYVGRT